MATISPIWACVVTYPEFHAGPNFRASVEDRGRPVEGLQLNLAGRETRIAVLTNKGGLAIFKNVKPGFYLLSVDHDAGLSGAVDVDVKRDGPASVTIPLTWPSAAPIAVRSLSRVALYAGGRPVIASSSISLDLLDAISARKLKTGQAASDGTFDFGSVAPGLYFLDLNRSLQTDPPAQEMSGLIAVAVDPNTQSANLELDLGSTDCGLFYTDRSQCSHGELSLDGLRGRVLDASGASIAFVRIALFNPRGELVEQTQSDRDGNFASPHSFAGRYELVLTSPGFTPLRESVVFRPNGDGSGNSFLTVRMGVVGSCTLSNVH
jgi:Carboxypeptidase regulatory-like domain